MKYIIDNYINYLYFYLQEIFINLWILDFYLSFIAVFVYGHNFLRISIFLRISN